MLKLKSHKLIHLDLLYIKGVTNIGSSDPKYITPERVTTSRFIDQRGIQDSSWPSKKGAINIGSTDQGSLFYTWKGYQL